MPSEVRQQWDRLKEKCKEVGLPEPVMQPFGLGDKIQIRIGDPGFRSGGDTMMEVIDDAILYVWGYREGQAARKSPAKVPCWGGRQSLPFGFIVRNPCREVTEELDD